MSDEEVLNMTLEEGIEKKSCGTILKKKRKSDLDCDKTKKRIKSTRPGFGEEKYDETEYYFENGLRKVYPYTYTYTSYCKGRWIGQALLSVFSKEFRSHSRIEYEKFVASGRVTINGEKVEPGYILKDNDLIANTVHRHETAVLSAPLKIIHQSEDLVVVDKPPSIPVHPCGRYRNNTVAFVLAKEHGLKDLHVLHRLDRLTSGVLLFGKRSAKTREIAEAIRERLVSKEYLCRVDGNFPDEEVICDKPLETVSVKAGFSIVSSKGKPSKTEFMKLSYNGKTSVVLCKPFTGRMHQIRVHLQYLGFPIINDPIYNHSVFGPNRGKGGEFGKSIQELEEEYLKTHNVSNWIESETTNRPTTDIVANEDESEPTAESAVIETSSSPMIGTVDDSISTSPTAILASLRHYTDCVEFKELEKKYQFDPKKLIVDPECYDCTLRYKEPPQSDLIMYLHALRYKGEGWEFVTEVPAWAQESWQEP